MRGKALLRQVRARVRTIPVFHRQMALTNAVFLAITSLGCWLTSVQVPGIPRLLLAVVVMAAAALPLPMYLWEKRRLHLLNGPVTILWSVVIYYLFGFMVIVSARLGMGIPWQDSRLVQLDQLFGINIPDVMQWASHHWLGYLANESYPLIVPLIYVAILLPILLGKVRYTQLFTKTNLAAFAIGLLLFVVVPAIGPWYGHHFVVNPDQAAFEAALLPLRNPGPYLFNPPGGVISFPSFHVIWAILSAQALSGFRLLRIPVAVFSGMIVRSTMTTGAHYFCDVLGGIFVSAAAIGTVRWLDMPLKDSKRMAIPGTGEATCLTQTTEGSLARVLD
jgi:PAP2 superfamily